MNTITPQKCADLKIFNLVRHLLSLMLSFITQMIASVFRIVTGKRTGHALPKFAGIFLLGILSFYQVSAVVGTMPFTQSTGNGYTPISGTTLGTTGNDEQVFISSTGGTTSFSGGVASGTGFPIGFTFQYNGTNYSNFAVHTNGWILLGNGTFSMAGSTSGITTPLSTSGPNGYVNAIAAFARDLQGQTGSSIQYTTTGVSPNRTLVVQWTTYRRWTSGGQTGDNFNFQIRLNETTNSIDIVYGTMSATSTSTITSQVGIRGATNSDYSNRDVSNGTNTWATSAAGNSNSDVCDFRNNFVPPSGLKYSWAPCPVVGDPASTVNGSLCGVGAVALSGTPGANGTTLKWYSASTGGTALSTGLTYSPNITSTGTPTTYYVSSSTASGCESPGRTAVTATTYMKMILDNGTGSSAAAAVASPTSICSGASSNLSASPARVATSLPASGLSIPDNNLSTGATQSVSVSGLSTSLNNTTVKIAYVKLNVTHSRAGQITATLIAPSGATLNLTSNNGGNSANYTDTYFRTGATSITSGTAPFNNNYSPETAFSTLNGVNPNGTWSVKVADGTNNTTGTFDDFEIAFIDGNGLTYLWSNGGGTSANPSVTPGSTTTYNATITAPAGGCAVTTSNATVTVTASPVGGAVNSSATICGGSNSGTLTLSGHSGGSILRWELSVNGGGSWSPISNTTTTYNYSNLNQTTMYRAVITSGSCGTASSTPATITVNYPATFNVTGGGTNCTGGTTQSVGLSGSENGVDYQLMSGVTTIGAPVNGNGAAIDFGPQAAAGTYTVIATEVSSGCTRTMTGNAIIINTPMPVGGDVTSSASICGGTNSGTLTLSGHTGSITRWESSVNGGSSWSNISNTTTTFNYSNLTQTTMYRAFITSGTCGTATSTAATITVTYPASFNVTGGGVNCSGGTTQSVGLSGSETGVDYQLLNGVTTIGLPQAGTGAAIDFGPQSSAGTYTVIATEVVSGCTRTMTGSAAITNVSSPVGGDVTTSATVCTGVNSGSLTLSGHTGSVLRWESSVNGGGTWSNISNTTTTQPYSNLSQTTQYRAIITSAGCGTATSTDATITVTQPDLFTIAGGGSYCSADVAPEITLSGSQSGYTYQLKRGATNVGAPEAGTGSLISFGPQATAGTYTVVATDATFGCTRTMAGSVTVSITPSPSVTAAATNALICGSGTTSLSATGASNTAQLQTFNNTLPASGTSIPSSNATGLSSTISVFGGPATMAAVTNFSVKINLSHTNDDELEVYLTRPGGTAPSNVPAFPYFNTITTGSSVCLVADAGSTGNHFTNTVFSDAGSQTCLSANNPPFTGTYRPVQLFSTLTGNPNGNWTLKVVDDGGTTIGSFLNWSITMDTQDGVSYTWTSTPSGFSSSVEDPGTITPTISSDYHVTITNIVSGCTATSTTTVLVDPVLTATCNVDANATCVGAADGSITVSASGGTAPYTGAVTYSGLTAGTYTYTVTDALGCTATCSSTIIVGDVDDPVISNCPVNISVNNDAGLCGANVTWTAPTASDNCSVASFTSSHSNGSLFPIGTTTVTYTAVDPSGNDAVCSFDVTVADNEPPVITCPANISVGNTAGTCEAIVNYSATVTDNCSATIVYSPVSGSTFPLGTTTVTATATDAAGNSSFCTFDVTVNDTEFPVYAGCPANITVSTTGSCDQTVSWTAPVASDNCAGVSSSSNYNPGDIFPIGTTIVTYTAVDAAGNTTVCTFDVIVEDNEDPVITCPSDITISANSTGCSAIATFSASVTDNCSATLSYSIPSGSSFSGTTPVTVTATDPSGNTNSCTFNVIVVNDLSASSSATAILCNGGSATVTVAATGGTAPYSGDGTFTVTAGTYTYTVTDANGCTASTTITVSEPAALVASSSSTAILCNGGSATVTVSATGGTAPYSGEGSFTVTAGTYTYTVTDDNGCSASTTITISEPAALVASSSATAVLCNGGSATVTVSATGGTAPYSGDGSFTVTAGTYNYTMTDDNGCSSSTSITVTEPSAIVVTATQGAAILCNGGSTTVTVSATGGTAPYSGEGTFTVSAGTYTYTVTDDNGCSASTTITVTEPTALSASSSATAILCNGGSATVTVSATGGTAPYTGEGSFTVSAGTYTYTVTDDNGCSASTTITVSEPVVLSASSSATAILCNGGSATVTVSASGGTAPYSGEGTFTVTAGTYTYTVTDDNGCSASTTITVTEPTALSASSSATAILCNGGSATVTVSATGGTAPYSGDGTFTVTAGTYTYAVTDDNGCSASTTITVTEPTALSASSSATAILCNGGSATVTVSASGGTAPYSGEGTFTVTAGTYTYTVTDDNGCSASTTITVSEPNALVASSSATAILCNGGSATVTVSATGGTAPYSGDGTFTVTAGTYTYTVTDDNGCSASTTITVSEPNALSASSSATAILCNGGSATVTISATGGTAPYSGDGSFTVTAGTYNYTVTDDNGCSSSTSITVTEPSAIVVTATQGAAILCNGGSTTVTVSATGGTAPYSGEGTFTVSAGTYTYTVTDDNGCSASTTITVTEPTALSASSSATAILCNGGSATVTVSASGGTAPYSGEGTFTVTAGTYTYTVTDDNGCSASTTITVSEPNALVASSSATAILCNGGSATVTVSATGGTAPYTGEGSFTVTAGTYTYTVTDDNGCTASITITVTEPTALSASSSATAILCNGGSATVTVSATGGTAPYSGEGTFTVTAGTYTYTVTDDNGCSASTTITVSEPSALVASSSATAILCNGGSATVTVSATGGTAPYSGEGTFTVTAGTYTYTVTDDNGCSASTTITVSEPNALVASSSATAILCNGGSATVTVSAIGGTAPYSGDGSFTVTAGTYTYTVTDDNGCSASTTITVSEPVALSASSSSTAILCNGGSATVTVSATGGTAPYSGDGTFTVTAGTYTYTVTDDNGCSASTTITVSEPAALVASSSATAILCNGGTATVTVSATGGTAPYTGEGSFTVSAGTYTYTVTDDNGCSASTTITVSEPVALSASSSSTAILCNGGSATVTVSATGGTAPYTGEGSFTVSAGTYTYTVTDDNGCSASTTITVTEPTALSASSSATAILCNGGSATVTVSATGGTAPYSGDGSFTVTAGTYTYTVTDDNGCSASTTITVSEPVVLSASSSATAILCNGGSATVTVSASGGTAPYSGEGSFTVTAGTYTYTVTDDNGCSASTTITVSEPSALVASSSATAVLCNGGSATVTVSATGGTAPYTGEGSFTVTAGTYNYTVTDNNGCSSSTSITVTEPSAIVVTATQGAAILCNGGSTAVTVSATGGTAPYSGEGTFTVTAGIYTYTITDDNGCTGSATITVSEPAALVASSSATAILCNGGSATVTVSATGGTAPYSGDGSFTVTAGTYTYVVTDDNGCSSSTTITVTEPAVLVASSSAATIDCVGGTTTVTVSATGGTTPYSGIGSYTESVGTYTYIVTDNNGCTSSTTITLTQVDNQDPIISNCPSDMVVNTSGSCDAIVTWTAPTASDNCSATLSSNFNSGDVFPIGTTTVNYTAIDPNGNSASCSFTVTVEDHENPVVNCPADIAVNNDAGVCGAVVNYSATVSDNCSATLSYSHASGSMFAIGTTAVTLTATDASGNSVNCSFNVIVTDSEYPVLTACPADITTCNPVVSWTAPTATDNCSATVSSNINPGSTFSAGTTVVTYSAIDASGNTTTCSFNVTVNIPSTTPSSISSTTGASLCNGTTTTLSVVGGSLGSGAQWVWYSGSCGGTMLGNGPSINVTPGATTSYFVRAEGGTCGNSGCASTTITVYTGLPAGVVNTINGGVSVCPGTSGSYSVNTVPNAGYYVWSAPAGTLIDGMPSPVTTTSNTATITFGTLPVGQSGYNICVFASNDCGSTTAKCVWIRGDLSTPSYFSAPTVVCAGTTVTYQVSPLAGASNYIWTATGGATISGSGTTVQVTFPANYSTGSVCVAGQSPCGLTSAQRCVTVTSSPGLPGAITGPATVCPGSTEVYSIAAVTGATSYIWTAPAGASISGPSNGLSVTVVYTAGFVSGQVQVKSVNTCGTQSGIRAKSISTGKLATPGNIVGDPTNGVCGQTYQYSIPSLANATLGYIWTIPAGVTVIGPSTSNSITLQFPANFVSGTLSVAGNNSCGAGYARSVNVYGNPATPGAITGNASVCNGSVEMYSWAPVPGTSYYQIQVPVGATILSGNITTNTFVVIQWASTGGNIGVKAINGCGVSGTRTLNVGISCRTAAEQVMTEKLVVEAYPNPNRGQFSVSVDSRNDATYTLRIMDQTGRILKTSVMNAVQGLNVQEFDLEGITAGLYLLRVETENREVINKTIIVQ